MLGVMIQGATRKVTLSWNTRVSGRSCRGRSREGLSQKPGPNSYGPSPAGLCTHPHRATARKPRRQPTTISAYRVGHVQQGDSEGNEAWEVGVREREALHVEVRAVLAARELQGVRGLLGPQDRPVPGGLFAP